MPTLFRSTVRIAVLLVCATADVVVQSQQPVANFKLQDHLGVPYSLSDVTENGIVVIAFLGTECPLAKIYGAQLQAVADRFADRGVTVLGINSNRQDTPTEIGRYARDHQISFPLLKDPGNRIADRFGAERTPEVFVIDDRQRIRYHGRIDDQFGVGYARPGPKNNYLIRAIEELLAGMPVTTTSTNPVGCHIGRVNRVPPKGDITYANQISRLIRRHCVECHRSGGIAPFALQNYEDVAAWAETLCEVVRDRRMPPWHADPRHDDFANDARMTDAEKQTLYDWVDNGLPQGDLKQLPPKRPFTDGWAMGRPNAILRMPEPVTVSAAGVMEYQYVTIDPEFTEDKWVRASEIRPGVRSVVHHILVFIDSPGADPILKEHGVGFETVGGYVPGSPPMNLAEGVARFVPAGSKFVMQIHYTPDGRVREDQSEIGLYFADPSTVRRTMQSGVVVNLDFEIPPNADSYRVEASYRFSHEMEIHSLTPHMHFRGKSFRYELMYPNGTRETLLDIPRYDFNWQNSYRFANPKLVPEGSLLKCVAHFDNSDANPANPDPSRAVRWGEQTWEEMMIGFYEAVFVNQDLSMPEPVIEKSDDGRFRVRFTYQPDRPAQTVHLAGTFNEWSTSSHPMTDADGDGIYQTEAILGPGEYRYKFVIDRNYWTHDPASRSLTGFLHDSYLVIGPQHKTGSSSE